MMTDRPELRNRMLHSGGQFVMGNEPFQQNTAKSIFARAGEIADPAGQAAYVAEACGGDAALKAEVERLLAAADEAGQFMAGPAIAADHTADYLRVTEGPGTVIGPYKLMEQIGEGGFGLVFVAEQHRPVRRKVALKIIKPGMDTRDVIARFEAERQALALMDHPNIAKVFDAGATDSGRPYFVMELVRGIPITDYCDQRRLAPRERVELFTSVCRAIQHAHQKGIIHRDVKPTNVLVTLHDGAPVVKVIDFGVAKALSQQLTERTIYTQFAQMIGTPLYMSPEQAEMSGLDIDTRSDIYSLGVLLYELLTGTTPVDRERLKEAAFDEIRRIIQDEEPPKPSTRISKSGERLASVAAQRGTEPAKLTKLVRGELDWIVMKCLEKDRNRRYETANGLARDIERYLRDEAVEACPPSTLYRLRKFVHKHRAAIVVAAAFVGLLIAGVAFSSWQAIRATRAESQALTDREAAEKSQARESQLRREAEGKGSIANALTLCLTGKFAEAEELMKDVPVDYIKQDVQKSALVYRALANWNGGEQRWKQAADDYNMIFFGPANDGLKRGKDSVSIDYLSYAPVLIQLGDTARYDTLRRSAINSIEYDRGYAERMLHAFLLLPSDDGTTVTPTKWGLLARSAGATWAEFMCWNYVALALLDYRRNDPASAMEWAQKSLDAKPPVTCRARAEILLAMAHAKLNQTQRAQAEIADCRQLIESKFKGRLGEGTYETGFWKDWLIDRILLREAIELIYGGNSSLGTTDARGTVENRPCDVGHRL
jgi:serine/threonine protein kinase